MDRVAEYSAAELRAISGRIHRQCQGLARSYLRSRSPQLRRTYGVELGRHWAVHTIAEERTLHIWMRDRVPTLEIQLAQLHNEVLDSLIHRLHDDADGPQFRALGTLLLELWFAHVHREEDRWLALILEDAGEAELKDLSRALQAERLRVCRELELDPATYL